LGKPPSKEETRKAEERKSRGERLVAVKEPNTTATAPAAGPKPHGAAFAKRPLNAYAPERRPRPRARLMSDATTESDDGNESTTPTDDDEAQ
jgi:hypothetical protein